MIARRISSANRNNHNPNGVKYTTTKVDIARLQEQLKALKENDLVHLSKDIADVKCDIKDLKEVEIKELHDKIDNLSLKIAKWGGAITVIYIAVQIILYLKFK